MSLRSNRGQKAANNSEDSNEGLSTLSLGTGGLFIEPPSLFHPTSTSQSQLSLGGKLFVEGFEMETSENDPERMSDNNNEEKSEAEEEQKAVTDQNDGAEKDISETKNPPTPDPVPVVKVRPNGLGDQGEPQVLGHPHQPLIKSIFSLTVSPAAERIRFILGEDDDGPAPPQLFTELDELLSEDGQEMEWKETAR